MRKAREMSKLTLRAAQELSGVSNPYISQLETGRILKPSPDVLRKLATAYGLYYKRVMEWYGYWP